jgi:hypothetical protein
LDALSSVGYSLFWKSPAWREISKGRVGKPRTAMQSSYWKPFVFLVGLFLLTFSSKLFAGGAEAQSVLEPYVQIQRALASDQFQGVPAQAGALSKALEGDAWRDAPPALRQALEKLLKAKDIWSARLAFKELSSALIPYLKGKGIKTGRYVIAHCPMVDGDWIQEGKEVRNPYYGSEMLECGEVTGDL